MRSLAITFMFTFLITNLFGQARTLLKYNLETGETIKIEDIDIPNLSADKTNFDFGENNTMASFPTELDLDNLYEQSQYTIKVPIDVDFNLNEFPIRASIKIFGIEEGELEDNCSGIMVSPRHVLTAAHCIAWGYQTFIYDSLLACPVYHLGEFSSSYECSDVENLYVFEDWSFWGEDFALLELKEPIGDKTGWIGIGYDDDLETNNKLLHKFSYPAIWDDFNQYNGDTLYYSYGYADLFDNENIGFIGADGVGGESGSSIIEIEEGASYTSYGVFTWVVDSKHSRMQKEYFYPLVEVISEDLISSTENTTTVPHYDIYPNPPVDHIYLSSDVKSSNKLLIRIYDYNGNLILKANGRLDQAFDISVLQSGMYLIRISDGQEDKTMGFIKTE